MASAQHVTTTAVGLTPATDTGVKLLWTFQLRKENADLLEKLHASERNIQACAADNSRCFQELSDRVTALESRLSTIESEERNDRQAIESWAAAVRILREQIGAGVEKLSSGDPNENIRPSVEDIGTPIALSNSTSTPNGRPDWEAGSEQTTINDQIHSHNDTQRPLLDPKAHEPPSATHHNTAHESNQTELNTSKLRTLRGRQNEISRSHNLPRIVQGTSQLRTYFMNAAKAFCSMPKDRVREIEFVAAFVKGLRESKQRDILVRELQKVHPCQIGKSGTVEIICDWVDVAEALKKVGLIAVEMKEERPAKRRKKILIPKEMIDRGL